MKARTDTELGARVKPVRQTTSHAAGERGADPGAVLTRIEEAPSMKWATIALSFAAMTLDLPRCREVALRIWSHCVAMRGHLRTASLPVDEDHVRQIRARMATHSARTDDEGRAARILVDAADFMLSEIKRASRGPALQRRDV